MPKKYPNLWTALYSAQIILCYNVASQALHAFMEDTICRHQITWLSQTLQSTASLESVYTRYEISAWLFKNLKPQCSSQSLQITSSLPRVRVWDRKRCGSLLLPHQLPSALPPMLRPKGEGRRERQILLIPPPQLWDPLLSMFFLWYRGRRDSSGVARMYLHHARFPNRWTVSNYV